LLNGKKLCSPTAKTLICSLARMLTTSYVPNLKALKLVSHK
jgi:hypothetical protein